MFNINLNVMSPLELHIYLFMDVNCLHRNANRQQNSLQFIKTIL